MSDYSFLINMSFVDLSSVARQWRDNGIFPSENNIPEDCTILGVERIAYAKCNTWEECEEQIIVRHKLIVNHNILEKWFIRLCLFIAEYNVNHNHGKHCVVDFNYSYTIPYKMGDIKRILYIVDIKKAYENDIACYSCVCCIVKIGRKRPKID